MGKAVHILLSKDEILNEGVCKNCGQVPLAWRRMRGVLVPRCSIGLNAQRELFGTKPEYKKGKHLKNKGAHGLTQQQAKDLRAEVGQCAICKSTENLVVDHCHATMRIRGVLCRGCNRGLGFFKDSIPLLERAIEHLKTPERGQHADTGLARRWWPRRRRPAGGNWWKKPLALCPV